VGSDLIQNPAPVSGSSPFLASDSLVFSTVMSSSFRNFALAWNIGFRFFLDPSTSPGFLLDWNHCNADGTRLLLGYGVESFHTLLSSYGTQDHRAKPLRVAQHGICLVLDEPSRFLGCMVHPL
jgi:hypothetical protein